MTDILGRMGNILRANLNDMLDHAEDPEKMIDQLVRDYTNDVSEAESAVAQTVGNLRLTEDDLKQAQDEVNEWGAKAAAAAQRGSQSAAAGNTADAARFDDLAKTALRQQIAHENKVKLLQEQVAQQTVQVDQLKAGLNGMRAKLEELQTKRDELAARAKMADAQRQVQESVASINSLDPTSDLGRYEDKIRKEEALNRGMAEVSASSLDAQFEDLDNASRDAEVETRLASLKSGSTSTTPSDAAPRGLHAQLTQLSMLEGPPSVGCVWPDANGRRTEQSGPISGPGAGIRGPLLRQIDAPQPRIDGGERDPVVWAARRPCRAFCSVGWWLGRRICRQPTRLVQSTTIASAPGSRPRSRARNAARVRTGKALPRIVVASREHLGVGARVGEQQDDPGVAIVTLLQRDPAQQTLEIRHPRHGLDDEHGTGDPVRGARVPGALISGPGPAGTSNSQAHSGPHRRDHPLEQSELGRVALTHRPGIRPQDQVEADHGGKRGGTLDGQVVQRAALKPTDRCLGDPAGCATASWLRPAGSTRSAELFGKVTKRAQTLGSSAVDGSLSCGHGSMVATEPYPAITDGCRRPYPSDASGLTPTDGDGAAGADPGPAEAGHRSPCSVRSALRSHRSTEQAVDRAVWAAVPECSAPSVGGWADAHRAAPGSTRRAGRVRAAPQSQAASGTGSVVVPDGRWSRTMIATDARIMIAPTSIVGVMVSPSTNQPRATATTGLTYA